MSATRDNPSINGNRHRGDSAPGRSFRLACRAEEIADAEALLAAEGFRFDPDPNWELSRIVTSEPTPLGSSLAARFGLIYIQDRSSMLPPLALEPPGGSLVLDMCASPGGKTGILAGAVGKSGAVLANEPSKDRLATLRMNLRRTDQANAATCSHAGERLPLPPESFSRILLDPPCSGWGTAEKNPKVMTLWSPEKVAPLVGLQKRLLAKAAELLTPGGRLVYSTCTTNQAENEDQVLWAIEELGLSLEKIPAPRGFDLRDPLAPGAGGVLRVAPGAEQGFFVSLLTKPGPETEPEAFLPAEFPGAPLNQDQTARQAAGETDFSRLPRGRVYDFNSKVFFLPEKLLHLPRETRWQGFFLGRMTGGRFRPSTVSRITIPERRRAARALVLDEPAEIRALLSGQSLDAATLGGKAGDACLYFRELPLARLVGKGKRLLLTAR